MLPSQKNSTIYIMKCIGILLVVWEHIYTYHNQVYFDNQLACMGKSVLMPTFLALGGYLIAGKDFSDGWLSKKTIKWGSIIVLGIVGYWAWSLIAPQLSMLRENVPLGNFIYSNLLRGFNGTVLWYLYVLLSCYVILWFTQAISRYFRIKMGLCLIGVIIIVNLIPFYILGFGLIKWYGIFLFLGYLIGTHKEKLRKLLWITYPAIGLLVLVWLLTNGMTDWQDLEYGRGGYTIIIRDVLNGKFALVGVMLGVSIIGILAVIGISSLLAKVKYLDKALIYIGSCSLGIYLIHPLFVGISKNPFMAYALTVGISLLIYVIFRKTYNLIRGNRLEAANV